MLATKESPQLGTSGVMDSKHIALTVREATELKKMHNKGEKSPLYCTCAARMTQPVSTGYTLHTIKYSALPLIQGTLVFFTFGSKLTELQTNRQSGFQKSVGVL